MSAVCGQIFCLSGQARRIAKIGELMENKPPSQAASAVILALDASAESCSASLWQAGQQVGFDKIEARHGHAARLVQLARSVWQGAGCDFAEITHIASCTGPGSFTGIRTALAAATGFVLAGSAQPVGISGFAASLRYLQGHVQTQLADQGGLLLADTRRGSFHACAVTRQGQLARIAEWPDAGLADCLEQAAIKSGGLKSGTRPVIAGPAQLLDRLSVPAGYQSLPLEMQAGLIAAEAARLIGAGAPLPALEPLYLSAPKLGPARQTG